MIERADNDGAPIRAAELLPLLEQRRSPLQAFEIMLQNVGRLCCRRSMEDKSDSHEILLQLVLPLAGEAHPGCANNVFEDRGATRKPVTVWAPLPPPPPPFPPASEHTTIRALLIDDLRRRVMVPRLLLLLRAVASTALRLMDAVSSMRRTPLGTKQS